jgi:carbon monoxide dehydrogenase subunit G
MISLERTVDTKTPVGTVAEFLSDFSTTEQWDPGTVRCRQVGDGPVAVGTEFENVSSFRGKETVLRYRVVEFEPGRRIKLVGENKTVTSTDDLSFEAVGGGTRVTYHVDFEFKGLARLAGPFVKGSLVKLCDEGAASMGRTLDALAVSS